MFDYTFHWRSALRALPELLAGALVTMEIAVLSMIIGTAIGVALAVARQSSNPLIYGISATWVEIARNTPALFQVYIMYFGLGSIGVFLDSYLAVLLGIAFNNAGYLAETFRGAMRGIPHTQVRAARSLGIGAIGAFKLVVLPQMFRIAYYPMTNQMVWAILMTSIGVIVGLNTDLTGVTQELNARTFRTFEFFALAALLYYAIAKIITLTARLLAWRLFRY